MIDRRIRVLALSPIPEEGAGCRFRIAQFIPYLEANGFDVTLSPLYTTEFFRRLYKPGFLARKTAAFTGLAVKRLWSLRRTSDFDVIFIYREIFPLGPALIEWLLANARRTPIVLDFDDAIFLPAVSDANRVISFLKFPERVAQILGLSRHAIVGNEFLAQYARKHAAHVTVLPTVVDTDRFAPRTDQPGDGDRPLVVGWIGTPTTFPYLERLAGVLRTVAARRPFILRVSGAGKTVNVPGVRVEELPWSLEQEVTLFNTCDVGVYPLTDDDWARGKCGFKAIQFMACGVPVVAAAVGVNREIVRDGENGFLASSEAEWVDRLERLLADPALRTRLAAAGRRTIEERYSLRVAAPRLAAILRDAATANGVKMADGRA